MGSACCRDCFRFGSGHPRAAQLLEGAVPMEVPLRTLCYADNVLIVSREGSYRSISDSLRRTGFVRRAQTCCTALLELDA
jgi:hypothetical protein